LDGAGGGELGRLAVALLPDGAPVSVVVAFEVGGLELLDTPAERRFGIRV
jgi:hypothetical protein